MTSGRVFLRFAVTVLWLGSGGCAGVEEPEGEAEEGGNWDLSVIGSADAPGVGLADTGDSADTGDREVAPSPSKETSDAPDDTPSYDVYEPPEREDPLGGITPEQVQEVVDQILSYTYECELEPLNLRPEDDCPRVASKIYHIGDVYVVEVVFFLAPVSRSWGSVFGPLGPGYVEQVPRGLSELKLRRRDAKPLTTADRALAQEVRDAVDAGFAE